jgi:hypothetical protein
MLVLSEVIVSAADTKRDVIITSALTGFEGDIVIAVVNNPSCKRDVGSIDRISSVGIEVEGVCIVLEVGVVDVDVLQQDLARVYECHGPHLALKKFDPLNR